ncbi:MAG: type II toxin-antitoxin system Phd/YefM family antitoxin [Gemmatimonadetes bacterium]|mgnify:CR=1 FL=1|jgi:prevent-host-death family protein|nr:type II toxin-antitoxin system Phd/YefM family antitoxin [Gemmatimonadota bacterium]MBT7864671.1 type II toxin-antitoxin system Phd/YefM family antitoxin [Gemmatimonadota bacterium]
MEVINVHEAKTHLSKLLQRVEAGEEIIIGRAGQPAAMLVPYKPPQKKRRGGQLKGRIWISPDFDAPDPELESLFYDGKIEPE